jgi:hypothetical protein
MTYFTINLPYAKPSTLPPMTLGYVEKLSSKRQARLAGRFILEPVIDLVAYDCRSVINKIVLRVHPARPTQFRYIADAVCAVPGVRRPHVEPLVDAKGTASAFDVTLQEPTVTSLIEVTEWLDAEFGFSQSAELRLLEVSVDFLPRVPSSDARARILGVLQRSIFPTRDVWSDAKCSPRFSYGAEPGEGQDVFKLQANGFIHPDAYFEPERGAIPPVDATLYLGRRDGECMIRLMDKVVDRQNRDAGTWEEVPAHQQRVRIEVVLTGGELDLLGLYSPDDLVGFNFRKLQGSFFRFMLPTFEGSTEVTASRAHFEAIDRQHFLRTGVLGLARMKRARSEARNKHRPALRQALRQLGKKMSRVRTGTGSEGDLVAYAELNRVVQRSLRNLTNREARGASRG